MQTGSARHFESFLVPGGRRVFTLQNPGFRSRYFFARCDNFINKAKFECLGRLDVISLGQQLQCRLNADEAR